MENVGRWQSFEEKHAKQWYTMRMAGFDAIWRHKKWVFLLQWDRSVAFQ